MTIITVIRYKTEVGRDSKLIFFEKYIQVFNWTLNYPYKFEFSDQLQE